MGHYLIAIPLGIYYASTIAPGRPTRIQDTDYRNYIEAFKDTNIKDKTMYDLMKQQGFRYVYEIQHWLRNFHDDYLKIRANCLHI